MEADQSKARGGGPLITDCEFAWVCIDVDTIKKMQLPLYTSYKLEQQLEQHALPG